jgi:aryl-alcohol dehydrogenase-like predicted oxidoreductase
VTCRLDYLDLYFIHWPFPNHHAAGVDVSSRDHNAQPYIHANYMKTWRQLELLVDRGLVRHIGTSNMTIPKLELLLRDARIKPAVSEMELHPHFQQPALFDFVRRHGIEPIGYSPIGSPGRPGTRPHPRRHGGDRRPGDRGDCSATRYPPGGRLYQVGGAARADADPLLGEAAQLSCQLAGRRWRAAQR